MPEILIWSFRYYAAENDGFSVCELLRRESEVPIIMLTALDGETEQIKGFDLLVDDYVTKPFSMPVLLRKIAAVLRRTGRGSEGKILCYEDIKMDLDGRICRIDGTAAELTQREFDLLTELLQGAGAGIYTGNAFKPVWGYDFFGDERIVG